MAPKTAKTTPTFASFTPEEQAHVDAIVQRALPLFQAAGVPRTELEIRMDLAAVHSRHPLRLADFAGASNFDLGHDIGGIFRHLDRTTGELTGHFLPRFARGPA